MLHKRLFLADRRFLRVILLLSNTDLVLMKGNSPISQPCCTAACAFSNNVNQVCRPSIGQCDIPENCVVGQGDCPTDLHVADGTSCTSLMPNTGDTYCASGQCTNRAQQCISAGNLTIGAVSDCKGLSGSCGLYCQDALGQCTFMHDSYFLNGTKCGINSYCSNGQCQQSVLCMLFFSPLANVS